MSEFFSSWRALLSLSDVFFLSYQCLWTQLQSSNHTVASIAAQPYYGKLTCYGNFDSAVYMLVRLLTISLISDKLFCSIR